MIRSSEAMESVLSGTEVNGNESGGRGTKSWSV